MCKKKNKEVTPIQEEVVSEPIFEEEEIPAPVKEEIKVDYFSQYYHAYKNDYIEQYLSSYRKYKATGEVDDKMSELQNTIKPEDDE